MSLFEGNITILNMYSEHDRPKNYFWVSASVMIVSAIITFTMGLMGYLAFGATTQEIILLNIPVDEPLAVAAKFMFLTSVAGNFIIMVQPIFC